MIWRISLGAKHIVIESIIKARNFGIGTIIKDKNIMIEGLFMNRYILTKANNLDKLTESSLSKFKKRISAAALGACPLTVELALLQTSAYQTCGKCVPCKEGLPRLAILLEKIVHCKADQKTYEDFISFAKFIRDSSDCVIGYDAAAAVLEGVERYKEEYESHILKGKCLDEVGQKIPCVHMCPSHVDIPGYMALTAEEKYADAINLIRKDNPFPTACAMICEHPCEERCKRTIIDSPVNIRGLKKFAVDQLPADQVKVPPRAKGTGKRIAVVGGGPSGLTAAYFMALMGHDVVVFEGREKLGGMLRYGIPNYRLPKNKLDEDINAILSAGGIEAKTGVKIGRDINIDDLRNDYDAVYIAIGAQKGKKLRIDGCDAEGVYSAVDILSKIGEGNIPDFSGKRVVVIGGGNVAMDCARTAVRAKAEEVSIVYRRRREDMTALDVEIEGAIAEGVELMTLMAPDAILTDDEGNCKGLRVRPQMIGPFKSGRPAPLDKGTEDEIVDCEIILIAVGQDIESEYFEESGIPAERKTFLADETGKVQGMEFVYAGGDCVTGPSTVIKAIAAGKVAAYNIDAALGFKHRPLCEAAKPQVRENERNPIGRVNITEREARKRKHDFEHVENMLSLAEAKQEASRCLRCDIYGCGSTLADVETVF